MITEEVTLTLEELIKKRIADQNFDDVQRRTDDVAKPLREKLELQDSKGEKGLGELYEEDYLKATAGPAAAGGPDGSATQETREEAAKLFKVLYNNSWLKY